MKHASERALLGPPATLSLTNVGLRAVQLPALILEVMDPLGNVTRATLGLTSKRIGSGGDCDLRIADPRVSRCHAMVQLDQRGVWYRDLGSKNGSFVGDLRVAEVALPPLTVVGLGDSRLQVRVEGEPVTLPLHPEARFGDAVGGSAVMRHLFSQLARAAQHDTTLLLRGESGTGKEVLARAIHEASGRKAGPFVVFDAGRAEPNLLSDELFGHKRGSFTGATTERSGALREADGGTLLLDEIGEMPLSLQPRLLRALETRRVAPIGSDQEVPFNVRVIAATHRDLKTMVAEGQFRQDLYYRLAVVEVIVPPLRDRKDDLRLLTGLLVQKVDPSKTIADLPPGAIQLLSSYDWPGNVRELRNIVERWLLFPEVPPFGPVDSRLSARRWRDLPLRQARLEAIAVFEREYLTERLREAGGQVSVAAEKMEISRQRLYELIEVHGLSKEDPSRMR